MTDYDDCELYNESEECTHPSADMEDGKWVCGICGCELKENMDGKK